MKGGREGGKTNLGLHQALDLVGLGGKHGRKVTPRLEREDPQEQAEDHAKEGAHHGHVAGELDPLARGGREPGQRDHEGDEDEDGVDDARRQREPLVQEVPGRLPPVGGHLVPDVGDDDGEAEDEDAHEQEQPVGDQVGDLDFVRHRVGFGVDGPPVHNCFLSSPTTFDIPSADPSD